MPNGRLNQKGFMDLINATDRSEVLNTLYRQVYPTKIGFEALIPFEQAKERTFRITRKKPIEFVLTTGDLLGKKDVLIEKYSKAEYVEDYVSIEKAFVFAREYSSLENLTPELINADLDEISTAEIIYKRKAFLDMIQQEAPKLEIEVTDIKKEALDIHDKMMDYLMEMGINIPNVWVFSNIDINRAIRNELKLNIGASAQIQQVLDGKDMILNGISSSLEGVNYVGLPKKASALGEDGVPKSITLLDEDVLIIAIEMNTAYRPFIAKDWTHTPLRVEKNPVGNGKGAVDILEYVKGYDVLPVEPLKMVVIKKKVTPPPKPALSTIITVKALGELANGEDATVLAGMEAKNTNAKGRAKIKTNDKATKVTFEPIDTNAYTGTVDCTYTVKAGK